MNDGSVFERQWTRNFEIIQDQRAAVPGFVGGIATGQKPRTAAAGAGDEGSGSSSSSSS